MRPLAYETTPNCGYSDTSVCTPREFFIRNGQTDPYPYAPPGLRGRPGFEECLSDQAYVDRLEYDDFVAQRAPDIANAGCFPGWEWVTIPPYDETPPGPPTSEGPRYTYGHPEYFSKNLSNMLRHDKGDRNGLKQFLDRRAPMSAVQVRPWNRPNRSISFQRQVRRLFSDAGNGLDTFTVSALRNDVLGYDQDWLGDNAYCHIAGIRALQRHIDPDKARFQIFVNTEGGNGTRSSIHFKWQSVLAIRCIG